MSFEAPRPRLPALTSLRFLAAFHVALFHMNEIGVLQGPPWLKVFAGIGYVGVSFFFVLSGFILVYTYAGRNIVLRDFWQTRFARIYPAYLFALLLTSPFWIIGALKMHVPFFAFGERHFALTSALVVLLLQSWVPGAALSWNAVSWSLSVEALFYLIFPFVLLRFGKFSRKVLWTTIPVCWLAGLAISGGFLAMRPAGAPYVSSADWSAAVNFVKFFPLVRLPEFLMGMACGFLFLRSERNPMLALPAHIARIAGRGGNCSCFPLRSLPYGAHCDVRSGVRGTGLWHSVGAQMGFVAQQPGTGTVWRCQLQLLLTACHLHLAILPQYANPGVAQSRLRRNRPLAGHDAGHLHTRLPIY